MSPAYYQRKLISPSPIPSNKKDTNSGYKTVNVTGSTLPKTNNN